MSEKVLFRYSERILILRSRNAFFIEVCMFLLLKIPLKSFRDNSYDNQTILSYSVEFVGIIMYFLLGCEVEIRESAPYFAAVNTNDVMIDYYIKNAKSLGVQFNDDDCQDKMLASTDMGNVSAIRPSIHPLFKIETNTPNHNHGFTEASGSEDNQLPTLNSAKSMAMTVIDVVYRPGVIDKVKECFEKSKNS